MLHMHTWHCAWSVCYNLTIYKYILCWSIAPHASMGGGYKIEWYHFEMHNCFSHQNIYWMDVYFNAISGISCSLYSAILLQELELLLSYFCQFNNVGCNPGYDNLHWWYMDQSIVQKNIYINYSKVCENISYFHSARWLIVEINCIDKENDWEYQGSYYQDSCCYFSARIWTTFIVTSLIMVFESIICNLVMTIVLLLGNINQCINNIHCINEIRAFVNYTTIVGEIKYNTNMVSILLHNSAAFIVLNKHFVVKMVINNGKHKIWRIYRSWLYAHDPIIKTIRTIFMRIITIFIQLYFTVHGNLYRLSIFYILFYLLTKNEPEFMVV